MAIVGMFIPWKSTNVIHRDFFQRSEYSYFNNYQHFTAWSAKISPVSHACVCLAALEVRLMGGAHRCEGRVEVKHQGEWDTVNDHNWNLEEAAVVCRQLGCGTATEAPRGAHFGPGIGPTWFQYIYCKGTESVLTACTYPVLKDYRPEGLSHDQDVGAVCSRKSCLVWEGIPNRKSLSLISRVAMILWITAFRTYLGEDCTHRILP